MWICPTDTQHEPQEPAILWSHQIVEEATYKASDGISHKSTIQCAERQPSRIISKLIFGSIIRSHDDQKLCIYNCPIK